MTNKWFWTHTTTVVYAIMTLVLIGVIEWLS